MTDSVANHARGSQPVCTSCMFYSCDDETNLHKCLRFSRFVDHVINDMTKNCGYWVSVTEE